MAELIVKAGSIYSGRKAYNHEHADMKTVGTVVNPATRIAIRRATVPANQIAHNRFTVLFKVIFDAFSPSFRARERSDRDPESRKSK